MPELRISRLAILLIFICLVVCIQYGMSREQSVLLTTAYVVLFALYVWIVRSATSTEGRLWITGALLARIALLAAVPNLSEDVYRYIWDGRVWQSGGNAFALVPADAMQLNIPGLNETLFNQLNSPEYFSVYPPVSQFLFWLITCLSPDSVMGSIIVLRLLVIAVEAGTIVLLIRLLNGSGRPATSALWYALNPLVILELSGNVHLEAFMIFFLLLAIYLLSKGRAAWSSMAWVASIGIKLMPILLLPTWISLVGRWRSIRLYALVAAGLCLLCIPVFGSDGGIAKGVGLFIQKFEFNSSIYYLVREFGWWKYGYNTIAETGWKLTLVAGLLILFYSFLPYAREGNLIERLAGRGMNVLFIFFLFATTVHPWYSTTLVALCTLTVLRYPVVWSAVIFLTYTGYSTAGYVEQPALIFLEYGVVMGYVLFESVWQSDSFAPPRYV